MSAGESHSFHPADSRATLDHYQGMQKMLDGDIYYTNKEIGILNNKIVKNDYDHTQIAKLQQRHQALLEKRKDLEEAVQNHQLMQREVENMKSNEHQIKHELGREYLQLGEEKRRRAEEERRRVLEQQRKMHEFNRRSMEEDYIRKRQVMEEQKRIAQEELAMREEMRRREKEEKQREKEEYNRKVMIRNQVETQKDSVYKQYYSQFMENQDTLHNIYKNKAAVVDREREQHRNDFQKRQIQEFQQRVLKDQEERVSRMNHEKDMLKSFLKDQMDEKQRRKSREREEELNYHSQVHRYHMNVSEAEEAERARRKQEQRRYDQQLKMQTRNSRANSFNSNPNPPNEYRQSHNPITNPIDFRIGITNPYVIKEYEQAKQKHLGDSHSLKVRNLAMVGNATLHHS